MWVIKPSRALLTELGIYALPHPDCDTWEEAREFCESIHSGNGLGPIRWSLYRGIHIGKTQYPRGYREMWVIEEAD
jgi:hypothetical protein